jgi:hypothetical protein
MSGKAETARKIEQTPPQNQLVSFGNHVFDHRMKIGEASKKDIPETPDTLTAIYQPGLLECSPQLR